MERDNFATKLVSFVVYFFHPNQKTSWGQEIQTMCPLGVEKLLFTITAIITSELSHSVKILNKMFLYYLKVIWKCHYFPSWANPARGAVHNWCVCFLACPLASITLLNKIVQTNSKRIQKIFNENLLWLM